MVRYSLFSYLCVSTIVFIAQPARADVVKVTSVEVEPTDVGGIAIVVTTSGGTLAPATPSTPGRSFILDIPNAQLQLPELESVQQIKPIEGIASVSVTTVDETNIRIEIIGETAVPSVDVVQNDQGLVLNALPIIASGVEEGEEDEEEITVVGSRRPTLRSETPATVDVVTEEEVRREQPLARSSVDLLQDVPGIAINRLSPLTGSLNIRGLTGERIGLLVDGERLPNRQFGPSFSNIDPFRIERIEVLKGPASSIYGADAFGGVVNIITSTPRPDTPFTVRTNSFIGSYAEFANNIEARGPNFIVGWTVRSAGDASDGDGDLIPLGTDYRTNDLYASGRVDLSPIDRLEIRLDRYRQNDADLPGFATPPNSVFQITGAENEFQNRDRYSLAYVNEGTPGGTSFSLRGYYQRFEDQTDLENLLTIPGQTIDRGPFLPPIVIPPIEIPGRSSSRGLTETYGFSAQANTPIGAGILTYGYDFSRDSGSSFDRIADQRGPLNTRTFNGVFLQSSYNVAPRLTLAGGLRFDSFQSDSSDDQESDDDAVTLNVGGIYRFTDELAFRANFAQGFRPATLLFLFGSNADRSFFAPTRGAIVSNPDLEPERANNIDVGLSYTSGRVRASVAYFHNDISNFLGFESITPRQTAAGFTTLQTANKDVLIDGVELSASYLLDRRWTIEGNFTYSSIRDTDGDPISQLEVIPLTVLLRLRYDDGRFNAYLQSRIYGGQGTVLLANNVEGEGSPPATVFDLQLGYRVTSNFELTLSVENLFDNDYIYPTVNFPAPGIRVLAGLRTVF
jgi:iron complex outermembrane recepter protein